jgi:N-carbamoylputrescine amidase
MTARHELLARAAAMRGAQIVGFPELFNSPYFGQARAPRDHHGAEAIPEGPTTRRMQRLAYATGMVIVAPVHETDDHGFHYSTAAVIDADGTYLGKCRKHHIPHSKGSWEGSVFRPGDLVPVAFATAVGRIGVCLSDDRHSPDYWQALGQAGAQLVYNPSTAYRGLSAYLWQLEQPAAAVANEYFVAAVNRVGREPRYGGNDFHGASYVVDPRGQFVGDIASATEQEVLIRDLDFGLLERESRHADAASAHKEREEEPYRVAARLRELRKEGRSGDAYRLMSEAAAGPMAFAPRFARALEETGLAAEVAMLLWELSAQPADRIAGLVRAFTDAARAEDCRVLLHQSAARPAADVAAMATALQDSGRCRDAVTLLTAFIRSHMDEETAHIARQRPELAGLLLQSAARISPLRHNGVAAALRLASPSP